MYIVKCEARRASWTFRTDCFEDCEGALSLCLRTVVRTDTRLRQTKVVFFLKIENVAKSGEQMSVGQASRISNNFDTFPSSAYIRSIR